MATPTLYTPALWASLLEHIEAGGTMQEWCKAEPGRPKPRTVREWAEKNKALQAELDAAFDDCHDVRIERARKTLRGKSAEQGGESTGDVIRDKAIAYYDLQIAERVNARYSSRLAMTHKGSVSLEQLVTGSLKPESSAGE